MCIYKNDWNWFYYTSLNYCSSFVNFVNLKKNCETVYRQKIHSLNFFSSSCSVRKPEVRSCRIDLELDLFYMTKLWRINIFCSSLPVFEDQHCLTFYLTAVTLTVLRVYICIGSKIKLSMHNYKKICYLLQEISKYSKNDTHLAIDLNTDMIFFFFFKYMEVYNDIFKKKKM